MKLKNITNRSTYRLLSIASLITLALCFNACKSKSRLADIQKVNENCIKTVMQKAEAANNKFTTINIPSAILTIKYGKNSLTMRTAIKIMKDSVISISAMPALGIEMFRINFFKDKFQVIDKINRKYAENFYNYFYLQHNLKIDYQTIENIFANKSFAVTTNNDYENWDVTVYNDTTIVTDNSQIFNLYNIQTKFNAEYQTIGISVGSEVEQYATLRFDNFRTSQGFIYPTTYEFSTSINKIIYALVKVNKIKFNEEINISPLRFNKYKRVTLKELMP